MKIRYLLTLVAGFLLLAACSDSNGITQAVPDNTLAPSAVPVQFDTYMGKASATRAGAPGSITTEVLKQDGYGFGVFAYQTGKAAYSAYRTQAATDRRYPNFLYNEAIVYNATSDKWEYAIPANTKYWPNEGNSSADDQNSNSSNDPATTANTNGGNVSFFAYGPFADSAAKVTTADIDGQPVEATDNQGTTAGIVAFSTSDFNGGKADATAEDERYRFSDPYLRYVLSPDADKQVDLLWGTAGTNSYDVLGQSQDVTLTNSEDFADYLNDGTAIANDHTSTPAVIVRPNYPMNTELTKQKTDGTVSFLFKHALAKIGGSYVGGGDGSDEDADTPTNGLMVILDIDKDGNELGGTLYPYAEGPTTATPYNTKVTINEIVLNSGRQLTADGLTAIQNNTTFDYATQTEKLGNNGIFNLVTGVWSNVDNTYATSADRTQTVVPATGVAATDDARDALLNQAVAEPTAFTTTAYTRERFEELPVGVTTVAKNVYGSDAQPFVFIPGTKPVIEITIDYTVRSYDAKLADNYTEVRQRITKRLYILDEIQLNKQYNILMHLGLTSMKFEATVSDWEAENVTGTIATDPVTGSPITTFEEGVEHVYLPVNVK